MMIRILSVCLFLFLIFSCIFVSSAHAFNQPWALNLGTTSFLDGGPDQPRRGLFFNQYVVFVHSDVFKDERGHAIKEIPTGVHMNNWIFLSQFIYISSWEIFGANFGMEVIVPYVDLNFAYSEPGAADILPCDRSGISDLVVGPFLQWDPIKFDNGMIFAHRFELQSLLPTGRTDNRYMANPSANHYTFDPYWAGTLYVNHRLSVSTRISYAWNAKNDDPYRELNVKETKPGQSFHANFSASYELMPRLLRLGFNGYYLRQTTDTKFVNKGALTPFQVSMQEFLGARQEVVGLGPGAVLFLSKRDAVFVNAYFESNVESRPECQRYQVRWAHQF